jgi:phosphatidylinositol-3,4,5-trisphosphate 3-phosphatase/dual-specificity protein phosphatase PTEN
MPNIIAMSYPSDKLQAIYKNDIRDVTRFLDQMHGGYYKVYNLCSERAYDPRYFRGHVVRYPIDDFNPPPITMMLPFCEDVDRWLSLNPRNVVAIHCFAGKGRTGTMICAYLLYRRYMTTTDRAVQYFNEKRMQPGMTAMHPSQVRYLRYFERLIRERFIYSPKLLQLWAVEFSTNLTVDGMPCTPFFTVRQSSSKSVFKSRTFSPDSKSHDRFLMRLDEPLLVSGDVKVCFFDKLMMIGKKELFWVWFNTYFVGNTLEECYGLHRVAAAPPDGAGPAAPGGQYWRPVPGRATARYDGSSPGSSCLVSVVNVGRRPTEGVQPASPSGGRCVTVTLPESELDRDRQSALAKVVKPGFTLKMYFTTVPVAEAGSTL